MDSERGRTTAKSDHAQQERDLRRVLKSSDRKDED